jgi:hypothetical protein
MPATPREPLPIVSAAFGLLTAGLLAARAFGVPVEWEVIITAAGIGGIDTARSLLGAGAKALRPVVALPPVEAHEPVSSRTLTAADARAIAEALAEIHAARTVAPLAPAPAAVEPTE